MTENTNTQEIQEPVVDTTATTVIDSTTAEDTTAEDTTSTTPPDDANEFIDPNDRKNVAKRIGKLSKKLNEKEQEIEYWRQQAMQKTTTTEPSTVSEPEYSNKPQATDFATNEDFIEALTEWKITQREAAIEATRKVNDIKNAYFDRVEAFKQSAPDFAIAVSEVQETLSRDQNLVEFIIESDVGPAIAYHLANNETELNRIMSMSPVRRIAALSRIETEFNSRKKTTADRTQPAPATRLTGNTGSAVSATGNAKPTTGDYSAWKKWREQNRRK